MNNNEIKKDLYKFNPKAELTKIDREGIHYITNLSDDSLCTFTVPCEDIQDGKFYNEMEAKHLMRWIDEEV